MSLSEEYRNTRCSLFAGRCSLVRGFAGEKSLP